MPLQEIKGTALYCSGVALQKERGGGKFLPLEKKILVVGSVSFRKRNLRPKISHLEKKLKAKLKIFS